jgi:hypothetical protein
VQSQQLPTESQVLEDEVLPGTENADQTTEEMSERHDHRRNYIGKVRIELCAKSFILQVYDVLARHSDELHGHDYWADLSFVVPREVRGLPQLLSAKSFRLPVGNHAPRFRRVVDNHKQCIPFR